MRMRKKRKRIQINEEWAGFSCDSLPFSFCFSLKLGVEAHQSCARVLSCERMQLYCIVLYLQPVLNPKSYDGARVLEASGRPMLVIGRSYVLSIQVGEITTEGVTWKLSEETTE